MNISSSPGLDLGKIKDASKKLDVTINDVVLCALTTSLNTIFKEKKDPAKHIQVVIPANIRFSFYKTKKDVQLENKFAAMTLKVPLTSSMPEAYAPIKKVTKGLRSATAEIYALYAISFWSGKLIPRFFNL